MTNRVQSSETMLAKLKKFKNPKYPVLGPNIEGLKINGLLQDGGFQSLKHNIIHCLATLFVLSQYVELWVIRHDLNSALRNLSISMLSTVCVIKAWTFVAWQKDWKQIILSISELELKQLSEKHPAKTRIIQSYIKYAIKVTYGYYTLVLATVFTVIFAPLAGFVSKEHREKIMNHSVPLPEIMSSWVPYDKTRSWGYLAYLLEHALICFYGGGIVASYDTTAIVLMSCFAGQLKLLKYNCSVLFGDDERVESDEEALINIKKNHEHFLFLNKFTKSLDSLLSPVMFLYIIICSLIICSSAIQLTTEGTTQMQKLWVSEYLMALIAQLFLYCWHGNEVKAMSEKVDCGVCQSSWWNRGTKMRRLILMLAGMLKKEVVFRAGPFTTLTLPTFVSIIKGAYSFYTILSKN